MKSRSPEAGSAALTWDLPHPMPLTALPTVLTENLCLGPMRGPRSLEIPWQVQLRGGVGPEDLLSSAPGPHSASPGGRWASYPIRILLVAH